MTVYLLPKRINGWDYSFFVLTTQHVTFINIFILQFYCQSFLITDYTVCHQLLFVVSVKINIHNKNKGGNQRDLARERNAKKTSATKSSETEANKGLSIEERRLRDAEKMRLKQLANEEKKKADEAQKAKK